MPEILLVNPRKRKTARRKKTVKKRRTAKQKAATRKLVALNKRRRKNPVTVKRRRRKPAVTKRRPSKRRAPTRTRRRARRRNPAPRLTMRAIGDQIMDASTGAVGALGLDIVQGYLPIPAQWKGGIIGTGVKALLAIGMGVVASNFKVIRGPVATKMVNGALIVVLHDELRKQVANFAPGLQLGEYLSDDNLGYAGSGMTAGYMGEDYEGMGTYLPELDTDDMGLEQAGLGEYIGGHEYVEDMTY